MPQVLVARLTRGRAVVIEGGDELANASFWSRTNADNVLGGFGFEVEHLRYAQSKEEVKELLDQKAKVFVFFGHMSTGLNAGDPGLMVVNDWKKIPLTSMDLAEWRT
ncbi:MAG: hypothetical protein GY851_25480, partial [bacterium]|nr:hypothetical protein [bacterium]